MNQSAFLALETVSLGFRSASNAALCLFRGANFTTDLSEKPLYKRLLCKSVVKFVPGSVSGYSVFVVWVLGFGFRVWGSGFGFWVWVLGFVFLFWGLGFGFLGFDLWVLVFLALGLRFWASGFGDWVLWIGSWVLWVDFWVLCLGSWHLGAGFGFGSTWPCVSHTRLQNLGLRTLNLNFIQNSKRKSKFNFNFFKTVVDAKVGTNGVPRRHGAWKA